MRVLIILEYGSSILCFRRSSPQHLSNMEGRSDGAEELFLDQNNNSEMSFSHFLVWNRITVNNLMLFMCSFDLNSSLTRVIFFIVCCSSTKEVFLHSLPKRWLVLHYEAPRTSSKSLASQERSETRYLHENQCTDGAHPVRSSLGNQDYNKQTR